MYWNRTTYGLPTLLLLLVISASPAFAAPEDDQYAVASAHYRNARWDLAADEFGVFLEQYPDHPRADTVRFFLGESLIQLAQYPGAERHFKELLERSPRHQFARQARFRLGEAAYLAGHDDQAREHLQRFRTEYPADQLNAYALPYLADIRLRAGEAQAAETDYAEALRKFPEGPLADECRFGIGKAYQQLGDSASAERFYRFLTLGEDAPLAADALLQIAKLQYEQQQYDAARQTLARFLERYAENPLRTQASYWLGKTQAAQGQLAEAAATFEQAMSGNDAPDLSAVICFDRAECLRQLGDVQAARQLYEKIQQQWPASTWAPEALQARVMLAFQADDAAAGDVLAEQFLREHGDHPLASQVRQLQGRSLLKHQQFDQAAQVFRTMLQATESRTARYYLALAELGAGHFEACLNTLRQVRNGADGDRSANELLPGLLEAEAAALLGLKRYAEAIEPLRTYLRARPEGGNAAKCRAQLTVALTHEQRLDDADPVFDQLRAECKDIDLLLKTTLYLAEANSQAGRSERARQLYGFLADEGNPPQYVAKGLAGLAWTAVKTNDLAESERAFGRLVERFPDAADAAEAALMQAASLERLQKSQEAVDAYRGVYERFPDAPQAPQAMLAAAQILESLKRLEDAERLLREAAHRYPRFERCDVVLYLHAWLLEDLSRGEEADAVFARLADQWPQSTYWADATYRLAERAAREGDYDQATELTDRLLANQAAGVVRCHALYLRGQLAATSGKWEQVDEPMGSLVREFPASELRLPAEYWRAEAAYRTGEYELAGQRFDQLARHTDGRSDPWLGMVPLRRAQVLAQQKKWQEAEALVAPIAEQFPGFRQQYEVDYLLGRCLSSRARFDDAREAFGRVVRSPGGGRTETAAMAQWMIGETFFLQKRYEEAVKAYYRVETLFEYPRWQATALLQAAKCREMQGNWNEAVKLYAQLLKDYPNTRFHEESSRRLRQAKLQATTAAKR